MRIGLLIDPIDPRLSYTDNIRKAADLDFTLVQLWYRDMIAESGGNPQSILDLLDKLGMELKSLAAYTDVLDPHRKWEDIFDELRDAMNFAAGGRIRSVVTESGGIPGKIDDWQEMIERFKRLTAYASSREVVLLVENGPGVLVCDVELMKRMVGEVNSPFLGLNFDPANLILVPDEVTRAVEELGSHIVDSHAKDAILLHDGSKRLVPAEHIFVVPEGEEFIHMPEGVRWVLPPVGEGDVDFPEYIAALKKVGFMGDLIIEFQGGGNREEAILRSREYLERVLK